jgi:phenylpropionate dioxygenase-like ring-hydroxylating dioxygenase large terminal subunit
MAAEPEDIFDPRHYRKARLPWDEAESLPPWCYTSARFYAREVERIFMRSWLCVGRAENVAKPGDFSAFDMAGVPVALVRGEDGALRAFANTCRHRGTKLLEGEGNCRAIACPYHGWTYALDGRLVSSPDMHRSKGFSGADYGLVPIRLESREGFLFVNFSSDGVGIDEQLGEFPELFRPWNLADMVCVHRREYDAPFNWKHHLEAFMEFYHARVVHRSSLYQRPVKPEPYREVEGEFLFCAARHEGSHGLLKDSATAPFPPIEGLPGDLHGATRWVLLFPAFVLGMSQDCMWYIEQHPQAAERTRVVFGGCFPKKTVARSDFAEKAKAYFHRWDTAVAEDNEVLARVQAGMASPFSGPGRLSHLEPLIGAIGRWLVGKVIDGRNRP